MQKLNAARPFCRGLWFRPPVKSCKPMPQGPERYRIWAQGQRNRVKDCFPDIVVAIPNDKLQCESAPPIADDLRLIAVHALASTAMACAPLRARFVTVSAYYDESGTHDQSPVTVLAGLVGNVHDCARFEIEWRKVLKCHGITHVRAKNLWHRQKQFKGWSIQKARILHNDLLYVLQEHNNLSISKTVMLNSEYDLYYASDGPKRRERLDSKYALCVRSCLHFNAQACPSEQINFVLEGGHRNAGGALQVWEEVKADRNLPWSSSIGLLSFGTKQDFPLLQAADMIAYWAFRAETQYLQGANDDTISDVERNMAQSGLVILDHIIRRKDLLRLRTNFAERRPNTNVFTETVAAFDSNSYFGWRGYNPSFDLERAFIKGDELKGFKSNLFRTT